MLPLSYIANRQRRGFDIHLVNQLFDSCRNCFQRYRTSSSPVRSRTAKAEAMTFVSQLDPQTSSWFDRSSFESQQRRTPSTNCMPSPVLSNSISTCSRWCARQQCRTPSTAVYCFHLRLRFQSAMSNSIDYPMLTRPVFSLEIAVELSDTAN